MGDYKVVVVGTDGSESSLRAVDEAAKIAAESDAKLIVASAYLPEDNDQAGEPDQPKDDSYKAQGNAPVYAKLREASDRARAAGAKDVEERPVEGHDRMRRGPVAVAVIRGAMGPYRNRDADRSRHEDSLST